MPNDKKNKNKECVTINIILIYKMFVHLFLFIVTSYSFV